MSKRRRNKEERDRKTNPYWTKLDEEEHEAVEDAYDENSDAESVSGRQEQKLKEKHRKNLYW